MVKERAKKIRRWMLPLFLAMLFVGYNATVSVQKSSAQSVSGIFWGCHPPAPCDSIGTAAILARLLEQALDQVAQLAENMLENFTGRMVEFTTLANLDRINSVELNLGSWWETMWDYNLLPSLQAMTRQLNTGDTSQARALMSATDAAAVVETGITMEDEDMRDARVFRPSDEVCVTATAAGGYGRATTFARAMRKASARESQAAGLNKRGTPGASGPAAIQSQRSEEYQNIFCDPDSNGGLATCAAPDAAYHNADIQPGRFIYNKLTLDVHTDPKMAKTVETIKNNMVGVTAAAQISGGALNSATGQQTFLDRRDYLARHAAMRSVPELITGWRMPGSQSGPWVTALREGAGIPLADISDNPSYKEIMHSMVVDRFNSGRYALDMITDESAIEMEKLTLNAFYLMQLRDYYDLLERTALTLAVQVAIMADQAPMPDTRSAMPTRQP